MTMKPTAMHVSRAAANSILRSFLSTSKRHLIITGSRGSGKSTLLREILALPYFSLPSAAAGERTGDPADTSPGVHKNLRKNPFSNFPGFTTHAFPKDRVELRNNLTGEAVRIGVYDPAAAFSSSPSHTNEAVSASSRSGNQMTPDRDGFLGAGIASVNRAIGSPSEFAVIDELGYLESSCPEFCDAIFRLFDSRRMIAVLRSQSTEFLDTLRARDDIFVYDLDHPVLPVGCVIMASGLGKRFGSNKLMADFNGEPLISRILAATAGPLFAARIVVTRSPEVEQYCKEREIPVLLHAMPYRNHTVRLGLSALFKENPDLCGCMFALGDQPLLSRETIEAMVLTFSISENCTRYSNKSSHPGFPSGSSTALRNPDASVILRLASIRNNGTKIPGNPILFGKKYFNELLTLPDNSGGNVLLKKYPAAVRYFPAGSPLELADADTPEELERLKKQK